jgi:regulator of PEP synthase PpsR (kinase-PPPase family)
VNARPSYFHIHLVSDATGETLMAVSRAAAAQYAGIRAVEHIHSMVRSPRQIEEILGQIERSPGIVLYTLVDRALSGRLEAGCRDKAVPCLSVLDPILLVFQSYLGAASEPRVGAQHALDADYFRRIEALNFTMMQDDGQQPENLDRADVVLIGVSRSSKTPTSIYLANRGIRTANVPLVPGVPPPPQLLTATRPLICALVASPERIVALRQNRILSLNAIGADQSYTDKAAIAAEIAFTRRLCARYGWPVIDVTRRSIEETAAAVLALYRARQSGAPSDVDVPDAVP